MASSVAPAAPSPRHPRWQRVLVWSAAVAALALPALAMQVTDEVRWGPGDFLAAAVLLGGAAGLWEWSGRRWERPGPRALAALAIGAGLVLVWATLAVGLGD